MGYGADVSGGMIATSGSSAYAINRSLRFRSSASAYLNRTPARAGNQQTWAWSAWVKRGVLGTASQIIFDANPSGSTDSARFLFYFNSSDNLIVDGAVTNFRTTSAVFRDPSSWYHIVLSVDTTQATATNRILIYVNGVSQSFSTNNAFTQNANTAVNSTTPHYMATLAAASSYFDGYLAEVNFVDGQALTPFAFGNFNPTTGVWGATKYVGTYGTNGFYLPFTKNTALTLNSNTGLGQDFSGNGNYWITNNISLTAGITYDSMTDVPTLSAGTASNYATMNPLQSKFTPASDQLATYSNANLQTTISAGGTANVLGTIGFNTGAFYFEVTVLGLGVGNGTIIGIGPIGTSYAGVFGQRNDGSAVGITIAGAPFPFYVNDVIGVAFNLATGTCSWYQNGTFRLTVSFTPSNYSNWTAWAQMNLGGDSLAWNFGQQPFVYSPPSGFDTLNTYNLPSPTIPAGNVAVNAITYTGGSSTPPGLGQVPKRTASTLAPVNSLRFRSGNSGYLNRTPITQGSTTTATLSLWIKRSSLGAGSTFYYMFDAGVWQSGAEVPLSFNTNDQLDIHDYNGSSIVWQLTTNAVFRDTSTWYHIVAAIDSTQPIPANRAILWVNGVQQTQLSTAIYPAQNSDTHINSQKIAKAIGRWQSGTSRYYDGYMSEFNFVDGQALTPSAFGTTNTDGQWVPIPYIGTYGTNGYRLPFTGNQTQSFNGSFNGTSQWVSTGTASSRFNLAQGDWTVEAWYFSTSTVSNNARYMVFTPGQALGADTSATNNTITVSGTPTWSQFSPYGTSTQGGSLYFNGTNTSLQSNSSTGNFLFGNANFTVEAWIYPLNISAVQYIASVWGVIGQADNRYSSWQLRINASGNLETVLNNGSANTTLTGSTVLTLRQWQHVAMVRVNNVITLFVNGVNVGSTAYTSTLNNTANQFVIGQQLPSSFYFNGYMTNLRIINGTALYTSAWFTPPTAALSIVNSTQTVLLMNVGSAGAYIADSSSYAQTLQINGTLVYDPASPYSPVALGGSAYLSGSSQYFISASNAVLAPGTGNFTIEAWIYPTSTASWLPIFQNDQVGSSSSDKFYFAWNNSNNTLGIGEHGTSNVAYTTWVPVLNTWYHLAAVRQSGVINIFINGVQQTVTNSSIFSGISFGQNGAAIGAMSTPYYFSGYITNIRYIVGFAQYGQSFTPVTTQALTAVPGTVLLINTTSNGLIWGLIPYNTSDFTLNLFGGSPFAFNMATVNASCKLNVWQHIALVRSGQTTTLYVDGVASAASAYPWWTNGTVSVFFGGVSGTYVNYFQGQISNFRIVMGSAVYTTNFTPQTTPLSAIQGTALLTMNSSTVTDSAGVTTLTNNNSVAMAAAAPFAANVTMDASGNSNHWFPNGIGMTTGTAYDTVTDVPADTANLVANSSTLNPVNADSVATITNGNLRYTITSSASWYLVIATQAGQSGGKYYFEITITNPTQTMLGLFSSSSASRTQVSSAAPEYLFYLPAGTTQYSSNGAALATWTGSPTFATGDIAAFAYDTINGMLWLGRIPSGSSTLTWINTSGTANPATATDPRFTGVPAGLYPGSRSSYVNANGPPTLDFNFGQQPFVGTVPTGFTAINTYTNPVATAWWGNGNSYPDLTWIKSRSAGTSHMLMDTVRGPSLYLSTNTTNPQFGSGGAYNWSKYGLVLANDGNTNVAGNTYVLWGWTAGQGNAIVNTSGSISSTVSANPTAGFSIVSFNQSSAANYSIGHGLGVTPNFWIFKVLNGSYYWVGHSGLAYNQYLQVNSTAAAVTDSTVWNAPATSSVINVGSTWSSNTPNQVIAYCWTAVPGYSAFGSYTGNGSTDGPFVYTGFRPRWIMYKSTTEVSYWNVFDTARSTYNVDGPYLNPNVPDAEGSTTLIDIISNGFKLRASSAGNNTNGATYVYAAFAENPFKYALAR